MTSWQDAPVALGDARRLVDVRDAFFGPALDAAVTFGRTAVITPTDLGPLPLALRR